MLKIAFIGEQCAGKTTATNFLINELGGKQVKFIDKMYKINDILEVSKNRGFMQELGTIIRKYFGEDYFVKDFIKRFKNYKENENLYSDDARSKLEFEAVKKAGFYTIYIHAGKEIRKKRAHDLKLDFLEDHPIENQIKYFKPKCDYCIINEDKLEDFYKKILTVINHIKSNPYKKKGNNIKKETYSPSLLPIMG